MKAEELYELRIGASVTQKALATHLGIDRCTVGRAKDNQITRCISDCDSSTPPPLLSRSSRAYVNLHKVPVTGTSLAESLIVRKFDKIFMAWYCSPYGKEHS